MTEWKVLGAVLVAVSYTHLDVYKRQIYIGIRNNFNTRKTGKGKNRFKSCLEI